VTIKLILLLILLFGIKTLSYIKKYLGSPTDIDVERLQVEYEKLKDENLRLKKTVEELKKEVKTNY